MSRRFGLVLGLAVLVGAAYPIHAQDDPAAQKLRIGWEDFKKLYDDKILVVVDVRGADAYAAGHIPGARSIPYADVTRHAPELKKLNQPIVLYCA